MKTYAFRLNRGQDVKKEIIEFVKKNKIQACVIITAVGCLDKAVVRMAGATPKKSDIRTYEEKMEVVSLTGTISQTDRHLHIALSRENGEVIGGHLKGEAIVDMTMEIVIGELDGVMFTTEMDKTTGYQELKITKQKK